MNKPLVKTISCLFSIIFGKAKLSWNEMGKGLKS